jgi:hypothetical protein
VVVFHDSWGFKMELENTLLVLAVIVLVLMIAYGMTIPILHALG